MRSYIFLLDQGDLLISGSANNRHAGWAGTTVSGDPCLRYALAILATVVLSQDKCGVDKVIVVLSQWQTPYMWGRGADALQRRHVTLRHDADPDPANPGPQDGSPNTGRKGGKIRILYASVCEVVLGAPVAMAFVVEAHADRSPARRDS